MAQQITTGEFQKEEETPAEEETAAPEVEIQDESVPEKEEVSDIEPQNPEGRDMIHDLMAEGFEEEDEEETAEETAETEDIRLEESIIAQVFAEDEEPQEAEQSGDTQEFSLEDECAKQMILQKVSADESEPEKSIEERILEEETPEERRTRILNDTRPEKLSDEQKKLFTYFAKVPGMDEQILNAMAGVYNNAGDKTSKRGNIAVMGRPGSGKTRLTDSLLRAICKRSGS